MKGKTINEFVNQSIKIYGDKYNYSYVNYITTHVKVKILCKYHGEFLQSPANHLRGNGCPKCIGKGENISDIINKAKLKHKNYDYSLVDFINKMSKIKIICPKHGIFEQRVSHHLNGSGCPKCVGKGKTTQEFIKEIRLIHGDKYNYSIVEYIDDKTKIDIICPKHGLFKQTAGKHLSGQGCPICKESKGEREIRQYLLDKKIIFIPQKRFKDCKDKRPLPFDFYLPELNICIEYQGQQHFKPISNLGGLNGFKEILKRDKIKEKYCLDNNIKLILLSNGQNINL